MLDPCRIRHASQMGILNKLSFWHEELPIRPVDATVSASVAAGVTASRTRRTLPIDSREEGKGVFHGVHV